MQIIYIYIYIYTLHTHANCCINCITMNIIISETPTTLRDVKYKVCYLKQTYIQIVNTTFFLIRYQIPSFAFIHFGMLITNISPATQQLNIVVFLIEHYITQTFSNNQITPHGFKTTIRKLQLLF